MDKAFDASIVFVNGDFIVLPSCSAITSVLTDSRLEIEEENQRRVMALKINKTRHDRYIKITKRHQFCGRGDQFVFVSAATGVFIGGEEETDENEELQ